MALVGYTVITLIYLLVVPAVQKKRRVRKPKSINRRHNILKPKPNTMAKPNHNADIKNVNKGTSGTNITWDKLNGNKGAQLNPNNQGNNKGKK